MLIVVVALAFAVVGVRWQAKQKRVRAAYLEQFDFVALLDAALAKRHPQLSEEMRYTTLEGLRDWFKVAAMAKQRPISMPSRVIDDAWHEFILFTRNYRHFCEQALGFFLHHTPAQAMPNPGVAHAGLYRTWHLACRLEGIEPASPLRLPRLFALDQDFHLENGFYYTLNCSSDITQNAQTGASSPYCVMHFEQDSNKGPGSGCGAYGGCGSDGGDASCGGGGCGGD